MTPIRGQVLRLKAPTIKCCYFWKESYIIPNVDTIVVGGTATRDDCDTKPRASDTRRILDEACKLLPALKGAEVLAVWAGFVLLSFSLHLYIP
jgi:D-amino-acid oxidase